MTAKLCRSNARPRSMVNLIGALLAAMALIQSAQAMADDAPPVSMACRSAHTPHALQDGRASGHLAAHGSDFYDAQAAPGQQLMASMRPAAADGEAALQDPLLGVFDSSCKLLARNDDHAEGSDAQVQFEVPADGRFRLAATACCDEGFTGAHDDSGAYALEVAAAASPAAATGGTISGILKRADGTPLANDGYVELLVCDNSADELCTESFLFDFTDANGVFSFAPTYLSPGARYQLLAYDQSPELAHAPKRSGQLAYDGSNLTQSLKMKSYTLKLSNANWAASTVPQGGSEALSFDLSNSSTSAVDLDAWLVVNADLTGSERGFSVYQSGGSDKLRPQAFTLQSGETRSISLPFVAASSMRSGSKGRVSVYVSRAGKPTEVLASYGGLAYEVTPAETVSLQAGKAAQKALLRRTPVTEPLPARTD